MLSEKMLKESVKKNRRYLDALEAADKKGKRPALNKVRKNFTVDEIIFLDFQKKCVKDKRSMSSVIEELMKKYS
jgi:hypothetical protein